MQVCAAFLSCCKRRGVQGLRTSVEDDRTRGSAGSSEWTIRARGMGGGLVVAGLVGAA